MSLSPHCLGEHPHAKQVRVVRVGRIAIHKSDEPQISPIQLPERCAITAIVGQSAVWEKRAAPDWVATQRVSCAA
ncbi:MAG: hypothetical protein AMXMBFR61_07230 [Fimbriimonadales bacterium]